MNYIRADRRIARTDGIIKRVLYEAAGVEDHKVINTHAYDKLLIVATWFEAYMETIMRELEKFKE